MAEPAKHFEDLWIWQPARLLVKGVYSDFGIGTSGESDFGFRNQIQSASISIMNNIASTLFDLCDLFSNPIPAKMTSQFSRHPVHQ